MPSKVVIMRRMISNRIETLVPGKGEFRQAVKLAYFLQAMATAEEDFGVPKSKSRLQNSGRIEWWTHEVNNGAKMQASRLV